MKTFHVYLLLSFLCNTSLYSQTNLWENYFRSETANDFAEEGDFVWIALSHNGIMKINKQSRETTFFSNANTEIPLTSVSAITIDKLGNKWIASNGLLKFDNINWVRYTPENSGLPSLQINSIEIDSGGNLWIGTDKGIAKFNGLDWFVFNKSNSPLPTNNIMCLENIGDTLWIGTDQGLVKFFNETWMIFNSTNSGIANNYISSVKSEKNGNLWIGHSSSQGGVVSKFSSGIWKLFNQSTIGMSSVKSIDVDRWSRKWIAGGGIAIISNDLLATHMNVNNSGICSDLVKKIFIDSDDHEWIASVPYSSGNIKRIGGVNYHHGILWDTIQTANCSLSSGNLLTIKAENNGDIWIGTEGGINKFNKSVWKDFYSDHKINMINQDRKNNLWFGTETGLLIFNGTSWAEYSTNNSPYPSNKITSMIEDEKDNIWIGTFDAGLIKNDGSTLKVFNTSNSGMPGNCVTSIAVDINRDLWVATNNGLVKVTQYYMDDGREIEHFDKYQANIFQNISSIAIDPSNKKWIGTLTHGLIEYIDETNTNIYSTNNSPIPSDRINKLLLQNDSLWIATDSGIALFANNTWEVYNTYNSGLSWNYVTDFDFDNVGNLWITSGKGGTSVFKISELRNNLTNTSEHDSQLLTTQNYPNPFNPNTILSYKIPEDGIVKINVYDIAGRKVKSLLNEYQTKGEYTIEFYPNDLASGVYIYEIRMNNLKTNKKMIYLK